MNTSDGWHSGIQFGNKQAEAELGSAQFGKPEALHSVICRVWGFELFPFSL